jgi:SNF2 family DNA or RNA helicase
VTNQPKKPGIITNMLHELTELTVLGDSMHEVDGGGEDPPDQFADAAEEMMQSIYNHRKRSREEQQIAQPPPAHLGRRTVQHDDRDPWESTNQGTPSKRRKLDEKKKVEIVTPESQAAASSSADSSSVAEFDSLPFTGAFAQNLVKNIDDEREIMAEKAIKLYPFHFDVHPLPQHITSAAQLSVSQREFIESYTLLILMAIRSVRTPPPKIKTPLMAHQYDTADFVLKKISQGVGCIVGNVMGLGKTLSALSVMANLAHESEEKRLPRPKFLVVLPRALRRTWVNETEERTDLKVLDVFDLKKSIPVTAKKNYKINVPDYADVYIAPYDLYSFSEFSLFLEWDFTVIFADEGHLLRNDRAERSVAFRKLKGLKVVLSGTPIQNSLAELWSLIATANPQLPTRLPFNMKRFSTNDLLSVNKILRQNMIRHTLTSAGISLPQKHVFRLKYELSPVQRVIHSDLRQHSRYAVQEGNQTVVIYHGNPTSAMRQLSTHPAVLDDRYGQLMKQTNSSELDYLMRTSGKAMVISSLIDKVRKLDKKVLFVCQFVESLRIVGYLCRASDVAFVAVNSKDKPADVDEKIETFKLPGVTALIAMTKAISLGLNLTESSGVVIVDADYNPQNDKQAEDRIYRIGQEKETYIYYLSALDSVEEQVEAISTNKLKLESQLGLTIAGSDTVLIVRSPFDVAQITPLSTPEPWQGFMTEKEADCVVKRLCDVDVSAPELEKRDRPDFSGFFDNDNDSHKSGSDQKV